MAEKNLIHLTKLDSNYDWNSDIDIMMNRRFRKVLLPIIQRVLPSIIAQQLIGIQPMTGPVASVYSLRYSYGSGNEFICIIRDCTFIKNGGIEIDRL